MQLIWPPPATTLDDDALRDLYAPDRDRPGLRVNFVTSLDGAVEVDGYSRGLSGRADQRVLSLLRQHCDALVVGAGTLRHEGYGAIRLDPRRRAWRRERGLAEIPTLVVVTAAVDLDPAQGAFADAPIRPVVMTHAAAPARRRAALEAVADVLVCGDGTVDLKAGVAALHERGLRQLLCEGGPHLFGSLLAADVVDELYLTVSPLLAGPGAGRIIAGPSLENPRSLRPAHIVEADGVLLTRYTRER
jgi:riboflavin biosynthesis pyrimidine reductase